MPHLDYVWQCFDKEKIVAEIPIKLHKDGTGPRGRYRGVSFNGKYRSYGRWIYIYDEGTDCGYMFVEFAAGNTTPKRHVFSQCVDDDDDVFELIPADHPLYNNEEMWSQNSLVHTNQCMVHLRKANPWSTIGVPHSSFQTRGGQNSINV